MRILSVFVFVLAFCVTGCASIVSKSQWPVNISSNPPGATVTVRDKSGVNVYSGKTPTTVVLSSSAGFFQPARYTYTFEKEAYSQGMATASAEINPWYAGNIILPGGLLWLLIVDPATGAMWKLDDNVFGSLSADGPTGQDVTISGSTSTEIAKELRQLKELRDADIITASEYEKRRQMLVDRL